MVISSNRADWIKFGIDTAAVKLGALGADTFDNVSDLRALDVAGLHTDVKNGVKRNASPPIYCPQRLGAAPHRNVYIVVHMSEYRKYKNVLEDTGITVVGWEFVLPQVRPAGRGWAVGFGASRFAAIEFCKQLKTPAPPPAPPAGPVAPWNYAWLFDDNVVALTNFAGLARVEAAMAGPGGPWVCAGLREGPRPRISRIIAIWR